MIAPRLVLAAALASPVACAHTGSAAPPVEPKLVYVEREVVRAASPGADQLLFLELLDQLPTGETPALDRLLVEHPESEWTARASSLAQLVGRRQANAGRAQRELRELQREQAECQGERQLLDEENRRLTEERERIKQLMIESEQRGRR